jgi:hypothetical protein
MRSPILLTAIGLLTSCGSDVAVTKLTTRLTVTPEISDVGRIPVGDTRIVVLTVSASSTSDAGEIPILGIEINNLEGDYFSYDEDTELPVVPGEGSTEIEVLYAPDDDGFHRGEVTVISDSRTDEITVDIRGQAVIATARITPTFIDFGPVDVGSPATHSVSVINESAVEIVISDASFTDDSYLLSDSLPLIIDPESSAEIGLICSPSSDGPIEGTMSLTFRGEVRVDDVTLRANDCERGEPSAYDLDGDGMTSCAGDCDDSNPDVHTGGIEICDGIDNDCDMTTDEGTECYDDDGDGTTEEEGDCNDADENIGPDMDEVADNGIDDDCDGVVDFAVEDEDDDGYTVDGGDCDDTDADVHPDAPELADDIDNDCDGIVDEGTEWYDDDGDGYSEVEGDCGDGDITSYPGAPELADWVDNDCDGTVDEGTEHYDDDGDGYSEYGGDCDDDDADVRPGRPEIAGDGIDNDCDGVVD